MLLVAMKISRMSVPGLCAFAPGSEGSYLALPASTERGSVLIYNTIELSSLCQVRILVMDFVIPAY